MMLTPFEGLRTLGQMHNESILPSQPGRDEPNIPEPSSDCCEKVPVKVGPYHMLKLSWAVSSIARSCLMLELVSNVGKIMLADPTVSDALKACMIRNVNGPATYCC